MGSLRLLKRTERLPKGLTVLTLNWGPWFHDNNFSAHPYHDQSPLGVDFACSICRSSDSYHHHASDYTGGGGDHCSVRGILNGYPGNSAILREYLQNTDDAKASTQASFITLWTTPISSHVLIVLMDLRPKGLHPPRTNAPCGKYHRSRPEGGSRTHFGYL